MTDFDKLIKEKAEQAEYAYKPAAWKSFRHHAGLKPTALKYWVTGVSSLVVVGGLTTFLLLRTPNSSQGNAAVPEVASLDTVSLNVDGDDVVADDTLLLAGSGEQESPRAKAATTTAPKSTPEQSAAEANQPAKAAAPRKNETSRYGRPLVIDVDTIKDNVPTDEELKNGHSRIF